MDALFIDKSKTAPVCNTLGLLFLYVVVHLKKEGFTGAAESVN